jgi:hypothetical protein
MLAHALSMLSCSWLRVLEVMIGLTVYRATEQKEAHGSVRRG